MSNCNKIWIGSNGYISFQNGITLNAPFSTIPTIDSSNANFAAGMLSDLTFTHDSTVWDNIILDSVVKVFPISGTTAWFWTNYSDSAIVQFDSVPFWDTIPKGYHIGRNTFQIILTSKDSSILYQYKSLNGKAQNNDVKTGIENIVKESGLPVLNDTTYPIANTAVKFYYPKVISCDSCFSDVTPLWNNDSLNGAFFMSGPYGRSITLKSEIANVGNRNAGAFSINAQVLDASSNSLYNNTIIVPRSLVGADSAVVFSTLYQCNASGRYTYRTQTLFSHDMNNTNDIQDVELVVVDTSLATCTLAYDDGIKDSSLSWKTNTDGVGIYLEPPFYPVKITSLDYYIAENPNSSGFIASIRAANANHSVGAVLFKDTIAGSLVVANAVNHISLSTPITINSGGIYVGWEMNGASISLGTSRRAPLSNRAYEIIGGNWSPYRYRTLEDFMIHVNIMGSNTASVNEFNNDGTLLSQNFPNPSSGNTIINYTLPSNGQVQFSLRNLLGQEMEVINFGNQSVGNHSFKLNTEKYSSGIYFYSLKFNDSEVTKKMVVSK
jgi:hypothetical protein